ncbi:MAG TPA: formate dehydrogenase subunit gamma [Paenalcaligenes sp.]|nr:formate dehydrogenase subunit gamma [Paenalcaligenes sp.]
MSDTKKRTLARYTYFQRVNHWFIALCFILLTVSGLALFHPSMYWMSNLLGSATWTRILHPFIGVAMFVAFFIFAIRLFRDNRITAEDRQWLRKFPAVINQETEGIPESGKYNGGQKLLFFVFILLMIGLLITGVIGWRSYFSAYFTIDTVRIGLLLHALFGFLLICSVIVHIYAGIWVRGSIRAMTRGKVSYGWAWKHHRAWFRKAVREQQTDGRN